MSAKFDAGTWSRSGFGWSFGNGDKKGAIDLFDQIERLDVGDGKFVELTDHNPAQIIVDDDGADLLIAAIVSARYGWGSSVEAFGRGGGSFTLTIGMLCHLHMLE